MPPVLLLYATLFCCEFPLCMTPTTLLYIFLVGLGSYLVRISLSRVYFSADNVNECGQNLDLVQVLK